MTRKAQEISGRAGKTTVQNRLDRQVIITRIASLHPRLHPCLQYPLKILEVAPTFVPLKNRVLSLLLILRLLHLQLYRYRAQLSHRFLLMLPAPLVILIVAAASVILDLTEIAGISRIEQTDTTTTIMPLIMTQESETGAESETIPVIAAGREASAAAVQEVQAEVAAVIDLEGAPGADEEFLCFPPQFLSSTLFLPLPFSFR